MDTRLVVPFIKSTKEIIKQMTDIDISVTGSPVDEPGELLSYGVSSMINFSGKIKGRFMLDMEPALAFQMASNLTGETYSDPKERMFLAAISEINNIIAGDANTTLNNEYSLGLRLAPPIVMTGRQIIVAVFRVESSTVNCTTPYGNLKLNIGFQGGLE